MGKLKTCKKTESNIFPCSINFFSPTANTKRLGQFTRTRCATSAKYCSIQKTDGVSDVTGFGYCLLIAFKRFLLSKQLLCSDIWVVSKRYFGYSIKPGQSIS